MSDEEQARSAIADLLAKKHAERDTRLAEEQADREREASEAAARRRNAPNFMGKIAVRLEGAVKALREAGYDAKSEVNDKSATISVPMGRPTQRVVLAYTISKDDCLVSTSYVSQMGMIIPSLQPRNARQMEDEIDPALPEHRMEDAVDEHLAAFIEAATHPEDLS